MLDSFSFSFSFQQITKANKPKQKKLTTKTKRHNKK